MKSSNKKIYLLIALAFLILLGSGATFVFNKLLHLDNYKGEILAEVQKALNRQVIYETGAFYFRFGPEFIFTNVVVKEKGGATNFISANHLTFKLAFLPLLEKKLILRNIELEKPVINISRDQNGVFNFSDMLGSKAEKTEEIQIQLSGIRIRKGELHFRDMAVAPQGLDTILKETDLSINHLGWGKKSDFKLAAAIVEEGKRGELALTGSAKVVAKDKPIKDTVLNVTISAKKLDASHFWLYYSRYVPFRQVLGFLFMESSFKGKLTDFSSKGKVRITGLRFDYPQIFHSILTPKDLNFNYDMTLNPVDINVKSLNLTVDGLNVKGSCALRDINTSDLRITAQAKMSTFNLENFRQYIPYGIIVKDTADYIEQHIKGGIYRLDDGRLDGRVSQIAHMERGSNYNVLFINGRVEKGLVSYGPDNPTFNNIKGTLEMRGKDFNLIKMSGNFGASPFTLDGKITDYPLTTPAGYPFTANFIPHQTELAWLLGKGKGPRLGFSGESTLHLAGAGPTGNFNLSGEWDLSQAAYSYTDLINKPAGQPNSLFFKGNITKQEMKISSLQYNLAPMILNMGATYSYAGTGHLGVDIKSNQVPVNDMAAMLPIIKKYQAAGKLRATVNGEGGGNDFSDFRWGGRSH